MSIDEINQLKEKLQKTLDSLIKKIGKVQIGNKAQFPFGWRKAAKGRTVWRILEELITQNLEKNWDELEIKRFTVSISETSVYDFGILFQDELAEVFVNIKSAVLGGKKQKDDISKGLGLWKFYEEDGSRHFFVATFFLRFNDDMTIEITGCSVFPIAWIPDIYVNPSNNANLQSSKYKDISYAEKRTTSEFIDLLKEALDVAIKKKLKKKPKRKKLKKILNRIN